MTLRIALSKLKNCKAGGNSNIPPEVVKVACEEESFQKLLLDFMHTVWAERQVPRECVDAILSPIPKKGNLSVCVNWPFLKWIGKVVARIIQTRCRK